MSKIRNQVCLVCLAMHFTVDTCFDEGFNGKIQ